MKNKILTLNSARAINGYTLKGLFLLLAILFASTMVFASDYYVNTNHLQANDNNPGAESSPWKTITKANQVMQPGDTVYIKQGNYTSYIQPNYSGTSGNPVTYRNYGSDVVMISGTTRGIYLDGKSYIIVQGINFYNLDQFMWLTNGSNHNIIAYCNFDQMRSYDWSGSKIYRSSSYNWIHHSSFSRWGQCSGATDKGSVLDIGNENNGTDISNYNLIEDSTLFDGGHHVLGVYGRYNTIRNNYLYNDAWKEGDTRGERTLYLNGYAASTGYNLIENNRFGYAVKPCGTEPIGVGAIMIATSYNILRHNKFYYNNLFGLAIQCYNNYDSSYNKVYNNTFFRNNYNADKGLYSEFYSAILFDDWTASENKYNVIKNNLFYYHGQLYGQNNSARLTDQTFADNFDGDTIGDPKFVNAPLTAPADHTDPTLPNLDLQSDSPAIDQGSYLTQANGSGNNSQTLIVDDASYFQGGTWAPAGSIQADWIAIGNVGNVVQISSISGNTITIASSTSWSTSDPIWLFKKSDGVQVLYGPAPDAGAYEVVQGQGPAPPTNLRIIANVSHPKIMVW